MFFVRIVMILLCGLISDDAFAEKISCAPDFEYQISPFVTMSNNTWNKAAAGHFLWSECIEKHINKDRQPEYGWSWQWPEQGAAVYAFPSFKIGKSPWLENSSHKDNRFPRPIQNTKKLLIKYDAIIKSTGNYNLTADIWFTKPKKNAEDLFTSNVSTELMIWSDYTPDMISDMSDLTKIADITINGQKWTAWGKKNWSDASGYTNIKWTYIAYIAHKKTTNISYDASSFISDAIAHGWMTSDQNIASVEIGTELVSGKGQIKFRSLSVTVEGIAP